MLKVFLVEDESIIRETLRDTVPWAQQGYQFAGEAGDGEMALPLIRQTRPDVLITDIRMPFMDGLDLSRLVLQEFPEMKVIILSGYDDFEYARQAIDIGVTQYLLKPITKNTLLNVLQDVREKIEEERAQRNYMAKFHNEAQEYEQFARKNFFERMVAGRMTIQQIYEAAAKLDLDLRAECYTIAFFSMPPEGSGGADPYSESAARIRDVLMEYFLKYPEYILLRWNLTTYALLIKSNADGMEAQIHQCIAAVQGCYETYDSNLDWYVAVGKPTRRLSALNGCYEEVSRLWAYRYILPRQHILTEETVSGLTGTGSDSSLSQLDASKFSPQILTGVMQSAGAEEAPGFVSEFLLGLADALDSKPFCNYLMLSVRFTATEFVASLGISQQTFLDGLDCLDMVGQQITAQDLKTYLTELLMKAVQLRDKASSSQSKGLLEQAVAYIDAHFTEEKLSLNTVAREVNISANYLSAVFSQEKGRTFIEYVTAKRMERARELLKTTDLRSGEVAAAVGYHDPHYFSFLFKKTQGCTPRDYRASHGGKQK
ncbi:MAG: response regulator [Clostridiales bacterium]|nr:response regulator [Clostridiales bacterium]